MRVLCGDCLEMLKTLPDESVHCCVTSPPYWGLRDYGTARWEGGDESCDHSQYLGGNGDASAKQVTSGGTQKYQYRDVCKKCGAIRKDGQLGLEKTPEEYVGKLVEIFREVRRVLLADGTCWLNLGDSYSGSGKGPAGNLGSKNDERNMWEIHSAITPNGTKPKDLIGIPWRVAFALQSDGWWLRQDIIWAKNNPMPESVRDRCTKAHEYIFLLTKSARYFYNAEAIAETSEWFGKVPDGWDQGEGSHGTIHKNGRSKGQNNGASGSTRNKRSVWTISTQPYPEAHFATFPEELPRLCILAGCTPGGTVLDPFCGAGTTGLVAKKLGHDFIGIELNPDYVAMATKRINSVSKNLFAEVLV